MVRRNTSRTAGRFIRTVGNAGALAFSLCVAAPLQAQFTDVPVPTHALGKPKKPPRGATVLFDGHDTSAWEQKGMPIAWNVNGEELEVKPGTGNILTKEKFGDYQLHVEFNIPLMPDKHSQERGNSGVYQQGLYEIQVLDAYNNPTYAHGMCAAIYGQKDPDKNACRPPGEWQAYDITFRAPRFDANGKEISNPRITVLWNGIKVHDNVEITIGPTTSSLGGPPVATGPIMLQDHGSPDKYRNIWIKPLSEKQIDRELPIATPNKP